jgi:DNA polymerase-3 subunit gamma/tau
MSLYNKYRPKSLSEVKGNSDLVATLDKMLSGKEIPHAFLLHGETGTGKTTIARIIADRLGCVGKDLTEVDSGQFRGIDTIREIRSNSNYQPLEGKCRVWILDECHRNTSDAQAGLLKILEDSPKNAYFILCTTDPQKLLPAIRGRCIQLQTTPLDERQMYALLLGIVKAEGDSLKSDIINQIIQDSMGLPRNAINILEQVLSASEDRRLIVAQKTAEKQSQVIELCRALIKQESWNRVNKILTGLKDQDPENIRRAVLGYCQAILLKDKNDIAGLVMENFIDPFYNSGFPGLVFACYKTINL